MNFDPITFCAQMLVLFFGVGLHEYAHCKFADLAGDPTPRYYGRVTLNLFKHFEPVGTLMMVLSSFAGYGMGWGRAAIVNPSKMKNPRLDWFISVAAGPISNLAQAAVYACAMRFALHAGWFDAYSSDPAVLFAKIFLIYGVVINLGLFFFNLIPFGPLDGHWLVGLILPEKPRLYWFRFNRQIGIPGLFLVVLVLQRTGINFFGGPISSCFHYLTGIPIEGAFAALSNGSSQI